MRPPCRTRRSSCSKRSSRAVTWARPWSAQSTLGLSNCGTGRSPSAIPCSPRRSTTRSGPDRRRALHRRLADEVQGAQERARQLSLAADGPDETVAAALDEAAIGRGKARSAERRRRLRGTGGIADAARVPRRTRPAEGGGSGVPDGCGQPRSSAGVARGPCFEHAAWDGTRGCASAARDGPLSAGQSSGCCGASDPRPCRGRAGHRRCRRASSATSPGR